MTDTALGTAVALAESRRLLERGCRVDATLSYEGYVLPRDRLIDGEYPSFAARGAGPHIWDVDGNRYLDFLLAYGTVILGHADPRVNEAVRRELDGGFALSLRKPVQVELAELLIEIVPGAERVLFLKTGSDATSAAVRLSRAITGRDRVVRWGYNGWHDWAAQRPAGVPSAVAEQVDTFTFNDLESLEQVFARHRGEIACCLMMPFELEPPEPGFLADVARITRDAGALFVLDEMRSGFRVALGGAQEVYGVVADLATFSKAIANGFPISVVTGREEVMRAVGEVHIGSTFFLNAAEMAAAVATLRVLREGDALERIVTLGRRFVDGVDAAIAAHGAEATTLGVPQMPFVRFTYADADACAAASSAFFTTTIRRGLLLHPNHHWFLCETMTDDDVDEAIEGAAAGFAAAVRAVER